MSRKRKSAVKGRGRKEKKVLPQVEGRVQMTREGYIFVISIWAKAGSSTGA